jgi:hypothetical protein
MAFNRRGARQFRAGEREKLVRHITRRGALFVCALTAATTTVASADILEPLTTFGGGDGWVAPGERSYLTTDNTQRGLAFNPATGNLLVVNRSGSLSVNILDGATGANEGTLNLGAGGTVSGGIFPLNMIGAADDGTIYAANLCNTNTVDPTNGQFRVYRWSSESAAAPTLAYNGVPLNSNTRLGDTLDVQGSGASTRLLAGTGNERGYVVLTSADATGSSFTAKDHTFSTVTPPPAVNDHQLGITFADGNTVIGTRGGLRNFTDPNFSWYTGFTPTIEFILNNFTFTTQGERGMDFAVIDGIPVVATVDTLSSVVRLYDFTVPDGLVLLDSLTNITGTSNANANGVSQVRFGNVSGNTATLYALNTNNGIQAFSVTLPEPTAASLFAFVSMGSVCIRGRRRRAD